MPDPVVVNTQAVDVAWSANPAILFTPGAADVVVFCCGHLNVNITALTWRGQAPDYVYYPETDKPHAVFKAGGSGQGTLQLTQASGGGQIVGGTLASIANVDTSGAFVIAAATGFSNGQSPQLSINVGGVTVPTFLFVGMQSAYPFTPGVGQTVILPSPSNASSLRFLSVKTGTGSVTQSWGNGEYVVRTYSLMAFTPTAGASAPTITDAGDETFFNGETGITITGTSFGASQGTGVVKISPTDNVNDPAAVLQTPTTWGDTSIQFTALQGYIAANATCYLFVSRDGGQTNTAGYPVKFKYRGPMVPTTLLRPSNATANGTGTVA
jgi:hypothetical protein